MNPAEVRCSFLSLLGSLLCVSAAEVTEASLCAGCVALPPLMAVRTLQGWTGTLVTSQPARSGILKQEELLPQLTKGECGQTEARAHGILVSSQQGTHPLQHSG